MMRSTRLFLLFLMMGLVINITVTWTLCFFTTRAFVGVDRGEVTEVALARQHFGWDQPDLAVLRYSGPAIAETVVLPIKLDPAFSFSAATQALRTKPELADPGFPIVRTPRFENNIIETRAGWPFRSLVGWKINSKDSEMTNSGATGVLGGFEIPRESNGASVVRLLPFLPIWPGLIANTLLYATTIMGFVMLWSRGRTSLRLSRSLCPSCKYPIGVSEVCTECGVELAEWAILRARSRRPEAAR